MSRWKLDYWKSENTDTSAVKKEMVKLLKDPIAKKQAFKLISGVEEFGPFGFQTKGNKHLKGGLFELRDVVSGHRYYYCETPFCYLTAKKQQTLVLLLLVVGPDKDKQQANISMARERQKSLSKKNLSNEENFPIGYVKEF